MTRFPAILAILGLFAVLAAGGPAPAADVSKPVVVELFTSQSCSSCPPAERFLGELAQEKGVVALEYHVDYWDDLVAGSSGAWKDRWSDAAYTARQRRYAQRLPGGETYTPQMVVGGRAFTVGSREGAVRSLMRGDEAAHGKVLGVSVARAPGGFSVAIDGTASTPVAVWLVRYVKAETTRVLRGENRGSTLTNHNIVRGLTRVGEWSGQPATLTVPAALDSGDGCAILVQSEGQGPILGAGTCPAPTS